MLFLVLQQVACLLPRRYRKNVEVTAMSATTSGVVQLFLCLGLFIYRYLHFSGAQVFGNTRVMLKAAEVGGETAMMGSGIFVLAVYLFQPITILLAYLACEGALRLVAANITGEVVPNLLLSAVSLIHEKLGARASELAQGTRVADQVEMVQSADVRLRIRSCRQKPEWDQRVTIFYNEELYEVAGTEMGTAPRRYVYLLRPKPASKTVRGTYHYSPTEALAVR